MKRRRIHRSNLFGYRHRAARELALVSLIVAVGLVIVLTRAATPTASIDAEKGSASANVGVLTSGTASNGSFVKFGAATGIPTACANGGTYLWANLATCGWPDASNTGPVLSQCGGSLTNYTGPYTRTTYPYITLTTGQSLSCKNINACVYVNGTNVTITNVKITCDSGLTGQAVDGDSSPAGHGAIAIEDNASATISNVEINANKKTHNCISYSGSSLTVSKMNCYNANDGIFSWGQIPPNNPASSGNNYTIQDSYLHDFTSATSNGHIDGYQSEGSSNGLIQHNTFRMTSDANNETDASIALWDSNKSSSNITVKDNLLTGGTATVYAEDYNNDAVPGNQIDLGQASAAGGFDITQIYFVNNTFSDIIYGTAGANGSTPGCIGYYFPWAYRGPGGVSQNSYYAQPSDINLSFVSGWSPTNFKWNNVPSSTSPIPAGTPSFRSGNTYIEAHKNIDNGGPSTSCN